MYEDLLENFLRGYESETTKADYKWLLTKAFEFAEGHGVSLEQMDRNFYYVWVGSRNWKESTRYHAFTALRAFLSWRFGPDTPLDGFKVRRPKPHLNRTLKPKVMLRVLESIDTTRYTGRRMLAILTLMLNTGMRAFEITSVKLADLDLEERAINVKCKGGIWRTAKFTDYTALCIASWLGARAEQAKTMPVAPSLFITEKGNPLKTNSLRRQFTVLGWKAGLEHFSPHDMRRTFATLATKAGASARVVMVAGGWTSLQSFLLYTQAVSPDDLQPFNPVDYVLNQ